MVGLSEVSILVTTCFPYSTPTETMGDRYLVQRSLLTFKAFDVPFLRFYHFCFVSGATSVFCWGYSTLFPMYSPTVWTPPARKFPSALKPMPIIFPASLIVALILSATKIGSFSIPGQCSLTLALKSVFLIAQSKVTNTAAFEIISSKL